MKDIAEVQSGVQKSPISSENSNLIINESAPFGEISTRKIEE